MSSKRGRKRNDNLPPDRARDTQRAFRARRSAHLEAMERRVAELEEENEYFRQALNLPISSRPQFGGGPTGKDQPYQKDKSRRQTISPSGEPSAGSPSSYASSPEPGPSLIAPSILSSRAMTTIDTGPPHRTGTMVVNEHHTALSYLPSEQGHAIGQSIPMSPMPLFGTPSSPNYPDRVLPPFHSSSSSQKIPRYSSTSESSIDRKFDTKGHPLVRRDPRDEDQLDRYSGLAQNYENSERYLHTGGMYLQTYHPIHVNGVLPSDRVLIRNQEFRRFPPEQVHSSHMTHNRQRM